MYYFDLCFLPRGNKGNKKFMLRVSKLLNLVRFRLMHVISYRRLREYVQKHNDCREALDNWYKIASKVD